MSSFEIGPVLPAMSLVPASITTAFGSRLITSCRNRTSICEVVCPPIPRLMYGLPGKDSAMFQIGDGISKEDRSTLSRRRRFEGGVGIAIARKLAIVIGVNRNARGTVLIQAGVSGGWDGDWLRCLLCSGSNRYQKECESPHENPSRSPVAESRYFDIYDVETLLATSPLGAPTVQRSK